MKQVVESGEIGAIKPQPRIYEVLLERFAIGLRGCIRPERGAVGIISVRSEAETDDSLIGLLRRTVKLRQTGEAAGDEWKHAGGKGVERPEVADGSLAKNAAHAVDHVVGGPASGLIEDDDSIHEKIV